MNTSILCYRNRSAIAKVMWLSVWSSAEAVVAALIFVLFTLRIVAAETYVDSSFVSEQVVSLPANTPVGVAWDPNGRMFIWQKDGIVRIFENGALLPTPFLDFSAKVNIWNDNGMTSFAFDPDYASNGFIYLAYVVESGGNPNDDSPKIARVVRVTANPANRNVMLPGSEVVIFDNIPDREGTHNTGCIRFGVDGTLYVGIGDGASPSFVDVDAFGAQDLNNIRGKIFRIRPDGTAPPDNPFYDGTQSIRSKVWCYGVRNPYRFSMHPVNHEPYIADVGWNDWEEIGRGKRGGNLGWPFYEGHLLQPGYNAVGQPAPDPSTLVFPLYDYQHSKGDLREAGTCIVGGDFYTGNRYPATYQGNYFYADYSGNWIHRMVLDANGEFVSAEKFASGLSGPTCIEQGPDGYLYTVNLNSGQIRRILYNGVVAVASATPSYGYSPLQVSFSSVGSVDSNGGALTYSWNFGDGGTSTAANPTHTYTSATVKTFTATVTVRNSANQTATASTNVTVGSVPPSPIISAPASGTGYIPGQTVTFQGSATDAEDGPIAAANLSWMVLLHHNTHIHIVNTAVGSQGSFNVSNHGTIGTFFYELVLTATDSSGLENSSSISLPVDTDSAPPSAPGGLVATAVSLGRVDLSWGASTDNGAVDSYVVERLDPGAADYVQVASLSGTSFSDFGLIGNQNYSYRVRAMDVSGNLSSYSNIATVTTLPTPPQYNGLVAAYGFNEGTGASANDASGSGNIGAIGATAWTTSGKYGNALAFNGVNTLVTVADASTLDLTTGMTLEAWVYPTAGGGWRDVIYKGPDDFYYLMGSSDNGTPALGGTFSPTTLKGSSSLPSNTWSHLAGSYDGTTMKLYVNGVLVSNRAQTGPIQVSTGPLTIGGDPLYGQYFSGRIDEVRVYSRALSVAEIQSDMNTPIGATAAVSPTISDIANQATIVNTPTGAISFTVGDADTPVNSLTVSGSSNNTTLVPNANIVFGGSGASRTVTVTPATNQVGTATITVTVSDGALTASDTFVLTVTTVNTPPTISDIGNQTINEDGNSGAIAFTVGDGETAAGSLTASGSSNNTVLVPNANIVFGGSGANRTISVTPAANQNGTATITVNVSDGLASASDTFLLTVNAVNDAPTISDIVDQSTLTGTAVGPLNFTVGDVETAAGSLTVSGSSSNQTLVPNGSIALGGSGANRTVTVTPAAGQTGNATITVSVSDGALTATDTFVLTVSSQPSGGLVAAYGFNEGSGTAAADASGNGNGGAIGSATWTASGKYGSALSFNGTSARVTVADANSLDLTSGMTLEAWVYPTAGGGWRDVIYKGPDDIYYLMGSSDSGAPAVGGTFSPTTLQGTSSLPLNTWSHLAGTYDGAAMRLYVNGVLVSNVARTGLIQVSTGALTIGGDALYGQYFSGRIDEVRVYNRALSVTEIQTDMNTPVGATAPASPTISDISNQSTVANTPTVAIPFTVGDPDTAVTSLTVGGSSNNTTLVPNANIVFGGSGANRTVTVTPAANQVGTATITVTVSDGALTASDTFVLTVLAVNTPPTISDISNQTINEDTVSGAIGFTVGDGETVAGSLTVSGSSNNTTLVPNANIVFGGSGASRTVTVTPAANQNGSATITVNVSDGQATASDTFLLTVNAINDAPTISDIVNQTTTANTATAAIPFTVGDIDTAVTSLTVSGSSNNLTLVPDANIALGGSGANRTVTVTPAANQVGTATITVTVSDGALTASDTFILTVLAVNTPPTISDISNQTINEDAPSGAIGFTVGDGETAAGSLTVSGSSNNATLVPNANIVFGGSGASRTVTVTPAANQNGTATITVNVSDGLASASDTFLLTVNAVNDAPTISDIANQSTAANTATAAIPFTVGDIDTAVTSLTASGSSNNLTLVPNANIVFGGSGVNRTVTVTPATGQSGSATITVSVSDGSLTATDTFILTVNAPVSAGLVAAYGFNESSGTIVGDGSGNGNNGTINGATRVGSGKFGGALSFNGVNNMVVINDSDSLDLKTGMTLEAWVMPAVAQSGWRTIIQKELDTYLLHAGSTAALKPATAATFGGNVRTVYSPTAIAVGQWVHLAGTYDGSQIRLYINGTQVASSNRNSSIAVNNLPVRIGGNSPYGEFFNGLIDEVRIYNRALSAAEIQGDMNTPVANGPLQAPAPPPNGPVPDPLSVPQVTIDQSQRNGAIVISVAGDIGQSYRIEASEDLVNWREFGTVADYYTGVSIVADMETPMPPTRFYRVVKSP